MMDAIDWLLLNVGYAVQWLWDGAGSALSWLWSGFVWLVNPVLSPVLRVLNPIFTSISDAVYAVVKLLPEWLGLTLVSAVFGFLLLLAFKYMSNQEAIVRVKDDIKANLLALKLYKDELSVTFKTQGRLLWAICRLQRYMLVPFLILLLPMVMFIAQMGLWYQWRPLHPGEQTLVKMELSKELPEFEEPALDAGEALEVEVGPIAGEEQVYWRVRAGAPGVHTVKFRVAEETVEKEVIVGEGLQGVSPKRSASSWVNQLLYPAESIIPTEAGVQSIEINYPGVESYIYGADWWILYFFVVSMVVALALAPVFKVKY
jgi:hypothetical protein